MTRAATCKVDDGGNLNVAVEGVNVGDKVNEEKGEDDVNATWAR
ncbi:MAG: hypothetical protein NT062_19090 [Proteobacteria bacterium]|nr:hypothetical protein [Pseudomonadota bacterium]